MNLLKDNIKKCILSTLPQHLARRWAVRFTVLWIWSWSADTKALPDAAKAGISPIWNIIFSLGLLFGIEGSVYFSNIRGREQKDGENENEYFTVATIGAAFFAVLCTVIFVFFDKQILMLFGADEAFLPKSKEYRCYRLFLFLCRCGNGYCHCPAQQPDYEIHRCRRRSPVTAGSKRMLPHRSSPVWWSVRTADGRCVSVLTVRTRNRTAITFAVNMGKD